MDVQQGCGVHSPRKVWQLRMRTLRSVHQRYGKCLLYESSNIKTKQNMLQGNNFTSSQSFATSPCDECLACLYHCSTPPWIESNWGEDGLGCRELQLCKCHLRCGNVYVDVYDDQADICISSPFRHMRGAGSIAEHRYLDSQEVGSFDGLPKEVSAERHLGVEAFSTGTWFYITLDQRHLSWTIFPTTYLQVEQTGTG